jgi:hypothetical protein
MWKIETVHYNWALFTQEPTLAPFQWCVEWQGRQKSSPPLSQPRNLFFQTNETQRSWSLQMMIRADDQWSGLINSEAGIRLQIPVNRIIEGTQKYLKKTAHYLHSSYPLKKKRLYEKGQTRTLENILVFK